MFLFYQGTPWNQKEGSLLASSTLVRVVKGERSLQMLELNACDRQLRTKVARVVPGLVLPKVLHFPSYGAASTDCSTMETLPASEVSGAEGWQAEVQDPVGL